MIITAKQYWNKLVPYTLSVLKYMPPKFYYLLTNCEDLHQYITTDIVEKWLDNKDNFDWYIKELKYVYNVNDCNLTSTYDISWIEEMVEDVCFEEFDQLSEHLLNVEFKPNVLKELNLNE